MKRWVVLAGLLCGAGSLFAQQGQVQVGNYGVPTTPAACLAASKISASCIAYSGAFTGLGVSGTTGLITLYTSNAPVGATFLFCPSVFITTPGSAGTISQLASYTTPSGAVRSGSAISPTAALTGTGLVTATCSTLAVAANSSLSLTILTVSGTGTPVWETEPVVTRIN